MSTDGTTGCLQDFFGDMIRRRSCLKGEVNVMIEKKKKTKNTVKKLIQKFNQ